MTERPAQAPGRVLATMELDGSRRWLFPRLSRGRFLQRRFVVAWLLILAFVLPPHLRMDAAPLVLLDVVHRRFTLLGRTFLATDLSLLMLFMVTALVAIVLLTALVGRAWCGWACPQTVYMEFIFRPLERFFEGTPAQRAAQGAPERFARRTAKLLTTVVVAAILAHSFLAWFVGWDDLLSWMGRSPFEHPTPFLIMAVTSALVALDFGWFREQTCLVACPYGRFQSVLLDSDSLIVGYDAQRGEPRGRPAASLAGGPPAGDCIACNACVVTCPTGIDIRHGLQMECIGCAQCIDACDAIMDRVQRPRGLIRYSSQSALAGRPRRLLRPRVLLYPIVLVVALALLATRVASPPTAEVTLLRRTGAPFTELAGGLVSNPVRLKLVNRSRVDHDYRLALVDAGDHPDGPHLIAPQNPVAVAADRDATATFFIVAPGAFFANGPLHVTLTVSDGDGFEARLPCTLLGPS